MNRARVIDKHDIPNDRMKEEILLRVQQEDGLFWMSRYVFGRTRLREEVHRPLAIWYKKTLGTPYALGSVRDPRGSGKSTMLVEDMPPWLVIQEPVPGTVFRGPESRIALLAPKVSLASTRVSGIATQFMNPVYRELTGDFIHPDPNKWSPTFGLKLLREGPGGEMTVLPLGLDSISTQLHPPLVIVDDPVHEKNWKSAVEIARAKMCVELAYNLTKSEAGVRMVIGNKWAVDDVQDSLRLGDPRYRATLKIWERGLICCEKCEGGREVPEGETREERHVHGVGEVSNPRIILLKRAEDGNDPTEEDAATIYAETLPEISSAQYDNDPQPPGTSLLDHTLWRRWEWNRVGDPQGDPQIVVGVDVMTAVHGMKAGDPRYGKPFGVKEYINLYDLDMFILIDPAPSVEEGMGHCRFAYCVVGCERIGPRIFLLEEYAKNRPSPEHYNAIIDSWVRWFPNVKKIAFESVGYQATIGDALRMVAQQRQVWTLQESNLVALSRLQSEGKQADRIRYTISPWLTGGVLYMAHGHKLMLQETKTFGISGATHDLLDALSNLARVRGAGKRRRGPSVPPARRTRTNFTGYGC